MKIYLVGGAVRDQLMHRPVREKDWVVVGGTIQEMLELGFRPVGKDFPVFLHPKTKEEYALARMERKIRRGYTGFEFDTSSVVTLEEDLKRRDLTINAIAQSEQGELIDPFHGQTDIQQRILRHVSPAFAEDPVRILRTARFAARFQFEVAPETRLLMQQMVQNGEVDALVPERVWKELERALAESHPDLFFKTLAACAALPVLFPEIAYPGSGIDALLYAVTLTDKATVRFAALTHPLSSLDLEQLCARYRIPNEYRELARLVIEYLPLCQQHRVAAEDLLALLLDLDAFRRESSF